MLILQKNGVITPKDDKTNIKLPFEIKNSNSKIIIDYSYSPKTVEDEKTATDILKIALSRYDKNLENRNEKNFLPLKNLVTLSLDSPSGYRGAAHRQSNNQHHEISKDFASVGFNIGEIETGIWALVLNVHSANCDINYDVKIYEEEEK